MYLLQHVSQHPVLYPCVGAVLVLVVSLLATRYRRGLRQVPGPFCASFTGFWKSYVSWVGNYEKVIRELHNRHGPYVRIGPNTVSIGDPNALAVIYGINKGYNKTELLRTNMMVYKGQRLPNLFAISNEAEHAALKRPVAHAYSNSALTDLEDYIDKCNDILVRRLDEVSRHGEQPVDMANWLQYYAFDVIGEITFSKPFGFLEQGSDIEHILDNIHDSMVYNSLVGHIPGLHELLRGNPLLKYIMPNSKRSDYITDFTLKRISERETANVKRQDLMGRLFAVQHQDPSKMPLEHILSHTTTNVFAGSDTTAIALRALVYYLCRNPAVYEKLEKEVQTAESNGELSRIATFAETQRLPYFQAFLKEVMRCFPPTGIILERRVPAAGLDLDGGRIHLPAGTIVGISAWVIHYDKDIFGADAEDFRPERWLEASTEQRKRMEKFWFTFGSGSRTCIGKNVALMEMNKVFLHLIRNFRVALADPEIGWTTHTTTVVKQSNLICRLTPKAHLLPAEP
ncbi:hypothetical protein Z517_08417 [Fonsecaea pedrosoi CBS 271.37]|uniref:Cytochrome P450 oxidoreductase n=1 Tax=Fonsecaea pedrosoi CBS 271.37 TaxID=1442368 RepID=A0A0D2H1T5_9EURO|nr:uncharacterized protein Z517_08417 [Fonsecaea pedrosoi CBS 271.37]KIW78579.1 hypothetical protein Z517_08417 [Fonsecaea pedrosoi CBS 271.37]